MRAIFVLLVIAGIAYGILRACGVVGGGEVADSSTPAATTESGGSFEAPGTDAPPVARDAPPTAALAGDVVAAARTISEDKPLGPAKDALTTRAGASDADGQVAKQLLAATAEDVRARWVALSALAEDVRFDPALRDALALRAVANAKAGLRAASKQRYTVVKGDSLEKICKKTGKEFSIQVTPGILRWLNGISGDRIKPNQELVLPSGRFRIVVSKGRFRLRAWIGDGIVREFPVAIGREDRTPIASFHVEGKLEKPPWDDPTTGNRLHYGEPGYALGTRWIAFDNANGHAGLGIHGTDDPASIGSAASLGCIRLRNADVEDLYELVPVGTTVDIVP